ncbi:PEP-CTERM sorting domain-containing protein [Prosthecobacter fusiformis]|nr:PEP-CTERM sorting domain-containing protein [Prosthecobacter fusiformis]
MTASIAQAQNLISSAEFFDPDFEVRRPGVANFTGLTVDTALYTPDPASQTAGNVAWSHSAGGLVQAGIEGIVDQQLAAYTRTQADSLIFGRELQTSLLGVISDEDLTDLTNDVVGASVINTWFTTATVANLNLSQGVLYSVNFEVTMGDGIGLNALSYANFTLLNGETPIQGVNMAQTLNLLDFITVGPDASNIEVQFYAPGGLTDIGFEFEAATVADVNLLGGITDNQTVLEFTNFSVAPVPEAGSMILSALGFIFILRRRRL